MSDRNFAWILWGVTYFGHGNHETDLNVFKSFGDEVCKPRVYDIPVGI